MKKILIIPLLCLCAGSAFAQQPTPAQPAPTQPAAPAIRKTESDQKASEKKDAKAATPQLAGEKVSPGNAEAELTELDRGWTQAGVRGDASVLERVLADDYSGTTALGKAATKAEAIAELKSGSSRLDSNTSDNYSVRVFGDTAVMTHDGVRTGQREGKAFSERYRSLHVFVKRGGTWQVVASQNMTLPPVN